MKPVLAPIFMVVLTLVSSLSQAGNSCFEGRDAFFTPYAYLNLGPTELRNSLKKTCGELARPELYEKQGLVMQAFMGASKFLGLGIVYGQGIASFSDMNDTPEQIAYMTALNQIRQIENPMARVRKVYYLATAAQGFYDQEYRGFRSWANGKLIFTATPENLLDSKKKYGTAGVCREFVSLLQWSLLQVARHPSSTQGGLSEKDFSSEIAAGDPGGPGHVWIRVHLPIHDSNGMILGFNDFDLDTTWYPEIFTILSPRESGIPTDQRSNLRTECQQIQQCIKEQNQNQIR